jgi:hypothetical protein
MIGRPRLLVIAFACLYVTALGFLAGIAAERIRFDTRRAAVLSRLTTAEGQVRARLMDLEGEAGALARTRARAALRSDEPAAGPGS